jgi:excisionase family DNA binding protein
MAKDTAAAESLVHLESAAADSKRGDRRAAMWDLDLLTPDDVCALLKVKKSWLYDTVESGAIEAIRLGKQLRFQASAIASYLAEQTKGAERTLRSQRWQQPFEPLRRRLPGLVKHMHVP